MNYEHDWHVFGFLAIPLVLFVHTESVRATEITVQNDSLVKGQPGSIQTGFVAGESSASWFTSPCAGNVVGVQVFWRSVDGTAPISFEDSITIFAAGTFPNPGAVLETIVAPVMTDGALNEFRFLDDDRTIPLIVPISNGQEFVVSFKFANTPNILFGPSVVTDVDGCQAGKNAILAVPGGWLSSCLLGVTGDFVIRAVVDCGALPGACCEVGGNCTDGISELDCTSSGGAFQGDGSICSGVTCPQPDGACCLSTGGCLVLGEADCGIIPDAFWAGALTDCTDANGSGTADVCEPQPCTAVDPPDSEVPEVEKNRFISLVPTNAGRITALRVTLTDLPGPYALWNGKTMWVTDPQDVTEQSGVDGPTPPPTFKAANLTCTPDCRDWGAQGLVDVYGEAIIPGAQYHVQAIDCACDVANEANYSTMLQITTSRHGDVCGPFSAGVWPPPDGVVNIPIDTIADVEKFRNLPTAPRKARADLLGIPPNEACLDLRITVTDYSETISAFRGLPYRFTPTAVDPCDALPCPNP